MTPTPEEVLADCRLRLDSLLPERDAAVFLSNVGKKGGAWEQAFVEALAVAYKSTDALAASQEQLQLLRDAVNDSSGECSPACSSEGHADDCEYVDMAATLVIQQRKLAASEEQLHALQLSHRIRGENIEMLERELMLFREATLR